jgi:hypothetical protein
MVKVRNGGITIEIPEGEIDLYKRAGYSVVANEESVAPVETVAPVAPTTPEEKNAEAVETVNKSKGKK